jgi:hypothetical protein
MEKTHDKKEVSTQEQIDELKTQIYLLAEHLEIAEKTGRVGRPYESAKSRLKKMLAAKKK